MKIAEKTIVTVIYDLYVDGKDGNPELMEQATAERPLVFCYGIGMMLPKFEEALAGLKTGDKFDFTIASEDAYGMYDDENLIDLDREMFEVDGKFDSERVKTGALIPLVDNEGNRLNASVVSVNNERVRVDLNHPLAGENLHFKGEVLGVHEATAEEIAAFFGGCGCSGCGSEGEDCSSSGCSCGCN
ncbi:MAG: FKBP-type peptidyl-prolyl cis-trans isomerase [Prevotellaceae bacterium]|jgi:FKBP-type peptidyl-prolyl cis-trans isomerase SlyD|nr:FKBP-type peptidyl-prolyl cis-trans isomerase [Prevotellaceae bacterium]